MHTKLKSLFAQESALMPMALALAITTPVMAQDAAAPLAETATPADDAPPVQSVPPSMTHRSSSPAAASPTDSRHRRR